MHFLIWYGIGMTLAPVAWYLVRFADTLDSLRLFRGPVLNCPSLLIVMAWLVLSLGGLALAIPIFVGLIIMFVGLLTTARVVLPKFLTIPVCEFFAKKSLQ